MTRRSRTVQVQAEKQPGRNSSSVCTLSRLVSSSARRTSAPDVTRQLQASSGSDGAHSSWPRSVRRRSNGRPPPSQATDQRRSRGGCRERRERAGLGQDAVRPTPQAARNRLGVSQGQKTCWYGSCFAIWSGVACGHGQASFTSAIGVVLAGSLRRRASNKHWCAGQ